MDVTAADERTQGILAHGGAMTDTVTHTAGIYVQMNGRLIQRCGWCGAKLIDSRGREMPTSPHVVPAGVWEPGTLVRIKEDEHGNQSQVKIVCSRGIPNDSCLPLVEN
jgi:hypothetical protein